MPTVAAGAPTASAYSPPDPPLGPPQRGEVVALGDHEALLKVAPGDVVLYPKYTGSEVVIDGDEHLIIEATDMLAVVGTAKVAA